MQLDCNVGIVVHNMLDQATFHMCGLEVDIMRLTEMILKVAQNYTRILQAFGFQFWVHLWQ